MKEREMRQRVVKALKKVDAISVENAVRAGTPDVNTLDGWIELKQVAKRPQRVLTPIRLPHFVPQQRVFLRRRRHKGGKAFVLLLIGRSSWFLFDGCWAGRFLGRVDYATLKDSALGVWEDGLNEAELLDLVSRSYGPCTCVSEQVNDEDSQ